MAAWFNYYYKFLMRIYALICISVLVAGPARADATQDALAEIAKCANIADSSERLKCFDAAVPRAKRALAAPPQPTSAKGGISEWFGFSRPQTVTKADDFGKPPPQPQPNEINEIRAAVVDFAKTAHGRSIFVLDNGQVWRQLDSDVSEVRDPPSGTTMKVTIGTGVLGSYNLTIDGRNALIKVRRLK